MKEKYPNRAVLTIYDFHTFLQISIFVLFAPGMADTEFRMLHLIPSMRWTEEGLGFIVWLFQGEIELEAAFVLSAFSPFFMDGMMKAQEDLM